MIKQLENIKSKALEELGHIADLKELEGWRVSYLGKKSELTQILRSLASLSPEQRKAVGAFANDIKGMLEMLYKENLQAMKEQFYEETETTSKVEKGEKFDVTLPGRPTPLGRLHPTTRMLRQICDVFVSLGFQVVEGPEVEWEHYNFDTLNIPADHPARDMWDTFWIDYRNQKGERPMLLRTHTSPMQVRVMEQTQPPVRVVVPGKCYRYEATDARHESMFYQIEGLAVDEHITFSDLKGTLYEFARQLFGEERRVRFRCDYFPFVEPGCEMAIDCFVCAGKGCRLCSGTGWIEILGAGMVHPQVLRNVGYDPERYTGYAFGIGVERISMLMHGIDDIRLFYANDLRFLKQF
ncbi:MAG: phenylalanine--tRNA ligase subunit alpha [Chloroflexota bacterium]|nr:phenylalanine--tRNA ligase subunit alpha [Chloroflexota bacterium]